MRQRWFIPALAASMLVVFGCTRPMFSSYPSDRAMERSQEVTVRFFLPPEIDRFAEELGESDTALVVDSSYEGFAGQGPNRHGPSPNVDAMHVALWGGRFAGHDVTYTLASLDPGDYTFALLDQDEGKAIQGWIHVTVPGTELVDVLRKWKANIPEQKQWLAYDFELKGKLQTGDSEVFKSFARQLRAFEGLERQLETAINLEMRAQAHTGMRNDQFLQNAEVLLLPGNNSFFRPTSQPAFSKEDMAGVRSGNVASRIVLVADYANAQWKLAHVNQVVGNLERCRSVFVEEAQRLARRKRFYTLTDHIYNHDRKFVENEMQLQQCLATIDRLNEQVSELRSRRTGLAFVSGLFASDGSFRALDDEERGLQGERKVLSAEKQRFDLLFDQAEEDSTRRVALERDRQRVIRAIEGLDKQLANLVEARTALKTLRDSNRVIHRQGDHRLLAASFVDQDIPMHIRQTIEREALMTIRLEATENVLVPTSVTSAFGTWGSAPRQKQFDSPAFNRQPTPDSFRTQGDARFASMKQTEVLEQGNQPARAQSADGQCDCPWMLKVLVPPCWFAEPRR